MSVVPLPAIGGAPVEEMREMGATSDEVRRMSASKAHPGIRQRLWGIDARLADGVTFEEYTFWAKIEREMEEAEYQAFRGARVHTGFIGGIKNYFTTNPYEDTKANAADHLPIEAREAGAGVLVGKPAVDNDAIDAPVGNASYDEKFDEKHDKLAHQSSDDDSVGPVRPSQTHDFDAEWRQAARALRTAGWGSMFYLITTDILGWGATPNVFAQTGYNYGIGIFVLMGVAAGCSGLMIWQLFVKLDSSRFPMLTFGDPFHRLFGRRTRHFINVMQALQQFLSVCILIFSQAQIISQMANGTICWIGLLFLAMGVGMCLGWLRSLKHLGWLCNAAVWINIATFVIVCVAAAKFGPTTSLVVNSTLLPKAWANNPYPVTTFWKVPPSEFQQNTPNPSNALLQGINSMVYSYSGAILFIAFLSEMRRPMDFWKATILAQSFITVVYIFFGAFVYSFFGQYSNSVITQSIQNIPLQYVCNSLSLVTGFLAIFLYFNIGFKTVYVEVFQEILHFPAITTKKGRYLWIGIGPLYWILALIVAASIPSFNGILGVVGSLFSLNFTYSIPAIGYAAYLIQEGARLPGEGFNPHTGETVRHDGGIKRYARGIVKKWWIVIPAIVFACLGLTASGLGTWSAILSLEGLLGPGGTIQTSWGCTALG